MQKIIFILILIVGILAAANIARADSKKIMKWVDSNGVTQYGDNMPVQEAGRNNAEMNSQGIVVKRNVLVEKKDNAEDLQKIEQGRKDKILLASYTNANEIDLALERNLQPDQAAIQALTQQKENLAAKSIRNNKIIDGFNARKKPLPADLSDEIKQTKVESVSIDKQIAQRKLNMEAIRKHYIEEKARFIVLKQPANVEQSLGNVVVTSAKPVVNTAPLAKTIAVKAK